MIVFYENFSHYLSCKLLTLSQLVFNYYSRIRSKTGETLGSDDIFGIDTKDLAENGENLESKLTIKSMTLDLEGMTIVFIS